MVSLLQAIIIIIVGIALYTISRVLPPVVNTVAFWIGILIAVIGLILLVLSLLGVVIG